MEASNFNWPLINDNITQNDKEVLASFILNSNKFTNGPKVKEFEQVWSDWLGVKHSVMVNSGASANYISIAIVKELMGVGEVIVPPLGWVSDISSVAQLGMTPVFVDVDLNNLAISVENIKQAITPKTKAVVLVHCLGFNGVSDELIKLCREKDILLIEDCCESHGAKYGEGKVGSFGDISLFSFYFGHHITTIEGGMVCTNSDLVYDLSKLFRSHGMTREASPYVQEQFKQNFPNLNPLFTFAVAGFNMRSTELNAVLGLEQMKKIDYNIEQRIFNLKTWLDNLDEDKFFVKFNTDGNSNFALPLILNTPDKDLLYKICDILNEEKVEYRLGTAGGGNQAEQPYLRKIEHRIVGDLEVVNYIHNYSLYIGNHPELNEEQIINLCKKLNNV